MLLTALFSAAAQSPGSAQGNRWERQVRSQLSRAVGALRGASTQAGHVLHVGPLNEDERAGFVVQLRAGVPYDVVAVCDDDCADLHMLLSTASGSDVAADRGSDNLPTLRFTPSRSGDYRVKVLMAVCRQNPCWYGVAVSGP